MICSYIGYVKKLLIVDDPNSVKSVYLNPETQRIDEVYVTANISFLYEMVSKARKSGSKTKHIAKTYFELETYQGNKQLELFQGYYNGTYQNYNTASLEMKNGRFALAPICKRIFASTETSKAMYMHMLFDENEYFPKSPFELRKRRLKKIFSLALNSIYSDEDDNTIYVISFKPRESKGDCFHGKIWIDSSSYHIQKVQLEIDDASIYPFKSFWPDQSLDQVGMTITKSFSKHKGEMVLSSTDFSYSMDYIPAADSAFSISTRAVLYAYNYNDAFTLPFFKFPLTNHSDYRRIQMTPHNDRFWQGEDEFKLESNNEDRARFINNQNTIQPKDLFRSDTIFKKVGFFENPFALWNRNRIIIKGLTADSAKYYDEQETLNSNRYNLKVQLFADINELCDTVRVITKTIFDPYESYYHFETTKESQAFINIYFDLMEIERRKLAMKLEKIKNDRTKVKQVYSEALQQVEYLSSKYFKEIQRGTNREALQKWNNVVLEELHINNIELFDL